jgi:hypothetical protein
MKEETANNRLSAMDVETLPALTERRMIMMVNLDRLTPYQGATLDKWT